MSKLLTIAAAGHVRHRADWVLDNRQRPGFPRGNRVLWLITSGRFRCRRSGSSIDCPAGSCLVNAFVPDDHSAAASDDPAMFFVQFDMNERHAKARGMPWHVHFDRPDLPRGIMDRVLWHWRGERRAEADRWFETMLDLVAEERRLQSAGRSGVDAAFSAVLDCCDRHPGRHGRRELAARAGLSERTFCRRFQQHTAMSFRDYIGRRREELASYLLEHSDLGLAEIAMELGFSDASHFTHFYQRRCGETPGRRRLQGRR